MSNHGKYKVNGVEVIDGIARPKTMEEYERISRCKDISSIEMPISPASQTEEEQRKQEEEAHEAQLLDAQLFFIRDILVRTDNAKKYLCKMNEIYADIEQNVELMERYQEENLGLEDIIEKMEACAAGLTAQNTLVHHALVGPSTMGPHENNFFEFRKDEHEQLFLSPDVNCCVYHDDSGDVLLVQVPPLASTYGNYQRANKGYKFPTSHLAQFGSDLTYKLTKIADELPHYNRYHFAYLHVYMQAEQYMIDNDNRDSKETTDAIAKFLSVTDHPLLVSFSNRTIISKTLPPASYVFVSEDTDELPRLSKMIEIFEQFFNPKIKSD